MILYCPKCQAFVEAEETGGIEYLRVVLIVRRTHHE
jgi:hypothetical protein